MPRWLIVLCIGKRGLKVRIFKTLEIFPAEVRMMQPSNAGVRLSLKLAASRGKNHIVTDVFTSSSPHQCLFQAPPRPQLEAILRRTPKPDE